VLRNIFDLKGAEVRGDWRRIQKKGPLGSVKRNKYSSSDEFEHRLAQQKARVRQIRGLYTHIL